MIITRKRLFVVLILLLLVAGFFAYRFFFTLYINSTNPSLGSVSYQTPFLELTFNKRLEPSSVKIEEKGVVFSDKRQVTGSTLKLYLNTVNLSVGEEASFSLKVTSKDGYSYSGDVRFTPRNISFNNLPDDQQKAIKRLEGERPKYYTDPVMKYIPYSTLSYSLSPNFITNVDGNTYLTIDLKVYLSEVDLNNKQAVIKQRVKAANQYLSSKGIDPSKYSINLSVVGG